MATLYKTRMLNFCVAECTQEDVEPENGTDFTLDELQEFVGGYIEIVHLHDGKIMVVNEEGRLLNLPPNWMATDLHGLPELIVGNALVCEDSQVK